MGNESNALHSAILFVFLYSNGWQVFHYYWCYSNRQDLLPERVLQFFSAQTEIFFFDAWGNSKDFIWNRTSDESCSKSGMDKSANFFLIDLGDFSKRQYYFCPLDSMLMSHVNVYLFSKTSTIWHNRPQYISGQDFLARTGFPNYPSDILFPANDTCNNCREVIFTSPA